MKSVSIIALVMVIATSAMAQTTKEDRKAAKKAKKEEQERVAKENTEKLVQLFESKQFVLEANTLFDRFGRSFQLSSTINFVGFDGKNSTIQLGFNQLVGWNGV